MEGDVNIPKHHFICDCESWNDYKKWRTRKEIERLKLLMGEKCVQILEPDFIYNWYWSFRQVCVRLWREIKVAQNIDISKKQKYGNKKNLDGKQNIITKLIETKVHCEIGSNT